MLEGYPTESKPTGQKEHKHKYSRLEDIEDAHPDTSFRHAAEAESAPQGEHRAAESHEQPEDSTCCLHSLHWLHKLHCLHSLHRLHELHGMPDRVCEGATTLWRAIWSSGMSCMAVASFLQSLGALSVKITNGRVPVFEIVLIRSGLCMAITIGMIKARGISPVFGSMANFFPLVVRGCAGAASMSLYYFAIFDMPLAEVMTVFYTHPAMVVALAWVCRGEAVSRPALGGMLASLAGVVLVAQPPFLTGGSDWSAQHISGVVNSLLAALLAAIAFVAIRFVAKGESSLSIALWFHTMGVVSSVIPLTVGKPDHAVIPGLLDSSLLVLVALCSFTSHAFIARAFQVENAAKSAAAGYLQVVFGYLYGLFIFNDSHSVLGVFGSALICVGVACVSWPAKKDPDPLTPGTEPSGLVEASKHSPHALQDYTVLELSPVEEGQGESKIPHRAPDSGR